MSASSLSFQVMGNVQEILVREGQKVHKGQLLASLNRATLQDTYDGIPRFPGAGAGCL